MTRDVQVIASREGDELVGFAQVVRSGGAAEITQVYVSPEHRGAGRGTAITRAAIEAAGDVGDLWITADDEDRPKELYARLGFRPAWTSIEFLRAPGHRRLDRLGPQALALARRHGRPARLRSLRIRCAALWPEHPVTPPPGWVPAPHR